MQCDRTSVHHASTHQMSRKAYQQLCHVTTISVAEHSAATLCSHPRKSATCPFSVLHSSPAAAAQHSALRRRRLEPCTAQAAPQHGRNVPCRIGHASCIGGALARQSGVGAAHTQLRQQTTCAASRQEEPQRQQESLDLPTERESPSAGGKHLQMWSRHGITLVIRSQHIARTWSMSRAGTHRLHPQTGLSLPGARKTVVAHAQTCHTTVRAV